MRRGSSALDNEPYALTSRSASIIRSSRTRPYKAVQGRTRPCKAVHSGWRTPTSLRGNRPHHRIAGGQVRAWTRASVWDCHAAPAAVIVLGRFWAFGGTTGPMARESNDSRKTKKSLCVEFEKSIFVVVVAFRMKLDRNLSVQLQRSTSLRSCTCLLNGRPDVPECAGSFGSRFCSGLRELPQKPFSVQLLPSSTRDPGRALRRQEVRSDEAILVDDVLELSHPQRPRQPPTISSMKKLPSASPVLLSELAPRPSGSSAAAKAMPRPLPTRQVFPQRTVPLLSTTPSC